ncbi:MAG: class I SAM-dependent methyltransferase [Planctomycetota bacterium]
MSSLTGTTAIAVRTEQQEARFRCVACRREHDRPPPEIRADSEQRPFDLVRCPDCGLVQQSPRYTPRELDALYRADYYVFAEEDPQRWARAVQQYAAHLLRLEGERGRRLLDVGCALGHLAALAGRRGWRVTGVDVSAEAISQAACRFGLDFRAGDLSQFGDTLPPFDVVLLGDVIEHVLDPCRFLQAVRRLLAPDGVVCVDTPNYGGRWRRFGGARWLGLNRYHINLFSAQSLEALLAACGFSEIRIGSCTHYRYESWTDRPEVQAIVRRLPRFLGWRLNRFFSRRARRKPWAMLREQPPGSLEEAGRRLPEFSDFANIVTATSHTADNLIAVARRG